MTDYERIAKVIHYLDTHYQEQPDLRTLAQAAGLSDFHFHRLFARWAGVTPKAFVKFLTAQHAKALLRRSRSVMDVSFESGLSGPGRLHDLLVSVDGVTPGEFKSGGRGIRIRFGFHETPFGMCFIAWTSRGICRLHFVTSQARARDVAKADLESSWPEAQIRFDPEGSRRLAQRIFKNGFPKTKEKIPVWMMGTPFQLKVWEALLKIPKGNVLSYQDIARSIGNPRASRAVGTALAKNPVGYLIPCHRVIQGTGIVGPYRWGALRKKAMLAWEKVL